MRPGSTQRTGAGVVLVETVDEIDPEALTEDDARRAGVRSLAELRRLIDRYATEVCLAICAGTEVPEWVMRDAPRVIKTMGRSSQLANTVEKACLHLTEATVLEPWVGHNFDGVTLKTGENAARVFIVDPPVLAPSSGAPEEGAETTFSLVRADPAAREVNFAWPAD